MRRESSPRPLAIAFNGGPGSSSVWLHMGGLAPKRVLMDDDGAMPRPPYRLVDNEFTWLTVTDLVFIDPVDTGYSRATTEEFAKKAKDVKGDLEFVGEFIRLYLTRYQRWTSPLFLAGESYGTYRSAGLAGIPGGQGHHLQRDHPGFQHPEHADCPVPGRERPAVPTLPADLRGDRLVPRQGLGRGQGAGDPAVPR